MLLDSNIIIYSFQPDQQGLRDLINEQVCCCSVISKIETLGYHQLTSLEQYYLEAFFNTIELFAVTDSIAAQAIQLKQAKKLSLGDALIAATALEHHQTLLTHNRKDFEWIEGLRVIDPL